MSISQASAAGLKCFNEGDHKGLEIILSNSSRLQAEEITGHIITRSPGVHNYFNTDLKKLEQCYMVIIKCDPLIGDGASSEKYLQLLTTYMAHARLYSNYIFARVICENAPPEFEVVYEPMTQVTIIGRLSLPNKDVNNVLELHRLALSHRCFAQFAKHRIYNCLCAYQHYTPIIDQLMSYLFNKRTSEIASKIE